MSTYAHSSPVCAEQVDLKQTPITCFIMMFVFFFTMVALIGCAVIHSSCDTHQRLFRPVVVLVMPLIMSLASCNLP